MAIKALALKFELQCVVPCSWQTSTYCLSSSVADQKSAHCSPLALEDALNYTRLSTTKVEWYPDSLSVSSLSVSTSIPMSR